MTWFEITRYYLENINTLNMQKLLFSILYSAKYIFMPSRVKTQQLANKYDLLKKNKIIYINSHDYDQCILSDSEKDLLCIEQEGLKKDAYIVFIDDALTHHSDIANRGLLSLVKEDVYGREICGLFDFVETHTGLKVVIALHPKAEYKDTGILGDRKMIYGKTRELVKYCSFAITYDSTAISYLMLYNKKSLFYYTDELLKNDAISACKDFCLFVTKFLNCRVVNIFNKLSDDLLENFIKSIDKTKRKKYLKSYVIESRKEITSYQLIDEILQREGKKWIIRNLEC